MCGLPAMRLLACLSAASPLAAVAIPVRVPTASNAALAAAPGHVLPPPLDDSELSAPSLLVEFVRHLVHQPSTVASALKAIMGETDASVTAGVGSNSTAVRGDAKPLGEIVREHRGAFVFGLFLFALGVLIHWFNERRSAKCGTLLARGLEECISIPDPDKIDSDTIGRLVHVQGQTRGVVPVEDPQFEDAIVKNCLKLQSTVEVFEWVQTAQAGQIPKGNQPKDKKVQYNFHQEWSTIHHNSLHFQRTTGKPSPENPRPPGGLMLGTFTTVCPRVQLGGFTFTEAMVDQFRNFQPAIQYLPDKVTACGMLFSKSRDGYFYARPGQRSSVWRQADPGAQPMVGDVRVRFLCVPEGVATVVAVHCEKEGQDTFVPYRSIPRCCSSDLQDRQRLIEEGQRPLREVKDLDKDMMPCVTSNRLSVSCFCCPCSTISCVCTNEVVTEEIFHVSATRDPIQKPFEWVVTRSPWRVTLFRFLGLLIVFLGLYTLEQPMSANLAAIPGLEVYDHGWIVTLTALTMAFAASAMIAGIAYISYQPIMTLKWVLIAAAVMLLPSVWSRL
mmetsp:Transcript_23450/g.41243  ORF Transcript_23450/g.41243 Transcript_23450/m.41243 type:complete len:558 (-) Transcript_23450:40-1713(-)